MHEVGIMQEVLDVSVTKAQAEGAQKISRIRLKVGYLSGVVPESLQFAFGVLKQHTLAQEAQLEIESSPVCCYCASCQSEFKLMDAICICPNCGELSCQVLQGRELQIIDLEII